ncbi:winged helix-turn-helix transcriptional regulator [Thalassospira sp. NFXS8]|uniref:MarR family winged helix-turn-helix transcriptional regulator n=1 Tax=Thalassospira sp. NFXS8 TaxID=2819093 RepID=UPI0032DFAD46
MTKHEKSPRADAVALALTGVCMAHALRRATRVVSRQYDAALARHGLTIGQFTLLAHIQRMANPSVQAVADAMFMDQSAMSRGLRPLEKAGLVISRMDPADKRRRFLSVSDAGRSAFDAAAGDWQKVQSRLRYNLGSAEFDMLRKTLLTFERAQAE